MAASLKICRLKRSVLIGMFSVLFVVLLWNSYYSLKILERNRLMNIIASLEGKNETFVKNLKEKLENYGFTFEPQRKKTLSRDISLLEHRLSSLSYDYRNASRRLFMSQENNNRSHIKNWNCYFTDESFTEEITLQLI